ncbi:MAG: metallopeptidase TldD-related protein [Bdellovibrionota bacterium]
MKGPNESLGPEAALETMRALLAGVAGISASDIFIRRERDLEIRSKNQELSAFREKSHCTIAIRLSNENSCIVSSSSDLSGQGLKELILRGRALLRGAQTGPFKRIVPIEDAPMGMTFDGSFGDVPVDEKVSRVLNMSALTVKSCAKYPRDVKATYSEKETEEWLWAPGAKRIITHKNTFARISARALLERTEGSKGFEVCSLKTQYFDLDWSGMARAASAGADAIGEGRPLESGRYRAVIEAEVMVSFVKLLGDALRGDRVLTSRSFLDVSQLEKQIFSESLNLVEDPERMSRAGYRLWDAEGHICSRKPFIEKGRLLGFAFDNSAGWREGHASNHQAVRPTVGHHPHPGFHSLSIPAESKDPIDLRRELDRGVWIQNLDMLTLLQPGSGEFMGCFSGRWIEKGEAAEGLTRILVRGDLKSLFSKIVSVSRDLSWSEHFGSPSVLVEELEVIGT